MRHAMKEGHEYLSAYSPNGGFIAFVWSDQEGKATARQVTLSDVKKFMTRKKLAGHYIENGYQIVNIGNHPAPVLFAPVSRIDDNTLEVQGNRYSYSVAELIDGEVRDFHLTLTATHDGETYDVKHISTRAQVICFLNHEDELTEQLQAA